MIHLRLRTEYNFRRAYGPPAAVLAAAGGTAAAITDGGTWGHVAWAKACKAAGVRPIFGVELATVIDAQARERQPAVDCVVLARNDEGLQELYALVSKAHEQFYTTPRIDYSQLNRLSANLIVLAGPGARLDQLRNRPTVYLQLTPDAAAWNRVAASARGWSRVVCGDNLYPTVEDRPAYEVLAGDQRASRTGLMHIPDEWELRAAIPEATDEDFLNNERVAQDCTATLPKAQMVVPPRPGTLYDMCIAGAQQRGVAVYGPASDTGAYELADPVYMQRLTRELDMIATKGFEDYFYVIADLVQHAKRHMLVGPARGSSAGSLVCYLLAITDVDPIRHDLMFERFIDITRADLPDIDIDFPDDRRDQVFAHLQQTYGAERVGRIGTILRCGAKSALGFVAKEIGIPAYEMTDLKGAVIERSTGDARAQFCVADALDTLDIGKQLVAKYPALRLAGALEGHAQTSGTHAAGVIVTQHPITHYCAIDRSGAAQIDKKDAEALNLLKIDALGLRTLSVLQDCLDQIGRDRDWLVNYPLDDVEAFEVLNAERFSGIFQFEGYALQSLTRQMKVRSFDDVAVIGALARPGPLHCGAAGDFIARRIGAAPVTYLHELAIPLTQDTYGVVIYQEQVMALGRAIGQLSWEDVSELRKAMSKSLGEEFFNRYWLKFEAGAAAQGLPSPEARRIWERMCTFGSWAFNKSHAVSYGMISYWCAMLKAHHPLEFAAACLRNAMSEDSAVKILRELRAEGYEFTTVDPAHSGVTWGVHDGRLVGGLTNIKGISTAKATEILRRRAVGQKLLPGHVALLQHPVTPYDDIFECERRFADYYTNPTAYSITSGKVYRIQEIQDEGEYLFFGKLVEKNLRDLNEYGNLVKRGGRKVMTHNLFLNMTVEDDTGPIIIAVDRYKYPKWGKPLVETARVGDWFLWKGVIRDAKWRKVSVTKWRAMPREEKVDVAALRKHAAEMARSSEKAERAIARDTAKQQKLLDRAAARQAAVKKFSGA